MSAAAASKPPFRIPRFKYTATPVLLTTVHVDLHIDLHIVGDPHDGGYEWVIVNRGNVEQHSDCGYGMQSIALRDGLIAFHGLPEDSHG